MKSYVLVILYSIFFPLTILGQEKEDDGMEILDFKGEEFKNARNQTWYWAGKNYIYEVSRGCA